MEFNGLSSLFKTAQTGMLADDLIINPNFLIMILAGVILALAIQFILIAISIAGGPTAIGDVKNNYVKSKVELGGFSLAKEQTFDQDYSSDTTMGVKITAAFGIWSMVTTYIALFGATALARNLNVVESE